MIRGACLCGAVTVTVAQAPEGVGACHCRMCQTWAGGLFLSFPARPEDVQVSGPVRLHASSSFAQRAFCERCGTHLWMRDTEEGADYDLVPGLFEAARDWPLTSEIYTDCAFASVRLDGDHPRATRAEYEAKNNHVPGGDA